MKLTPAQQAVVDRYMKATENCPEARMSVEKQLAMKRHITRYKTDAEVLAQCERVFLYGEVLTD